MSKKLDYFFWFLLPALPVLAYLIFLIKGDIISFDEFYHTYLNFTINPLSDAFSSVVAMFDAEYTDAVQGVIDFLGWFVFVELLHIFVDALLLLPRLVHNLMERFCEGKKK